MNPYKKYQQAETNGGWLRIDVLLALFDGAVERLDKANIYFGLGNLAIAEQLVARVQLIVGQLAAGIIIQENEETGTNCLRLYEYCLHELNRSEFAGLKNARYILATLREGYEAVREDARRIERSGEIPPVEYQKMVYASA